MKVQNSRMRQKSVASVFIHIVLLISLLAQSALPAFAQAPPTSPTAESMLPPPRAGSTLLAPKAEKSEMLYRTRIQVTSPARWQRLEALGVTILERGDEWALVLADYEQLETLARLRFQPEETDELSI